MLPADSKSRLGPGKGVRALLSGTARQSDPVVGSRKVREICGFLGLGCLGASQIGVGVGNLFAPEILGRGFRLKVFGLGEGAYLDLTEGGAA